MTPRQQAIKDDNYDMTFAEAYKKLRQGYSIRTEAGPGSHVYYCGRKNDAYVYIRGSMTLGRFAPTPEAMRQTNWYYRGNSFEEIEAHNRAIYGKDAITINNKPVLSRSNGA